MEIIGVQRVDYTSKKSGRPVKGWRVYYSEPRDGVVGVRCDSEFVSEDAGAAFFALFGYNLSDCIGVSADFVYRRFGNNVSVEGIRSL